MTPMLAVGKYMGERSFLSQMTEKMRQQSRETAMVKKQQLRYDFSKQAVTTKTHYRVGPVARGSDEFDLQCSV